MEVVFSHMRDISGHQSSEYQDYGEHDDTFQLVGKFHCFEGHCSSSTQEEYSRFHQTTWHYVQDECNLSIIYSVCIILSPHHTYAQLTAHDLNTSVVLNKASHFAISSVLLSHVFKYSCACFNHQSTVSPSFIVRDKFQISNKGKITDSCNFSGDSAVGDSGYEETYQAGDPIVQGGWKSH